GRGERARLETGLERPPAATRGEEARGELVAGAGGVDDPLDGRCRGLDALSLMHGDGPLRAAGDDECGDVARQRRDAVIELAAAGQVTDLVLIAEQHVDGARLDHPEHAFAAVADA